MSFLYVDTSIDSSLRLPLDNDLSEMRNLIDDLHHFAGNTSSRRSELCLIPDTAVTQGLADIFK